MKIKSFCNVQILTAYPNRFATPFFPGKSIVILFPLSVSALAHLLPFFRGMRHRGYTLVLHPFASPIDDYRLR